MTHAELLAATFAAESEDARTPAQSPESLREAEERRALEAMGATVADVLIDQRTHELERLSAADLVLKMRNVDALASQADEIECRRFAEIFERTAKQFEAAALRLRRHRHSHDTPEYLREGSTVALRAAL